MEATAGNSILDFETLFSDFQELLNGSGLSLKREMLLRTSFITKLLLRLQWFFRRTAALFRQIRTFPQLFRF